MCSCELSKGVLTLAFFIHLQQVVREKSVCAK